MTGSDAGMTSTERAELRERAKRERRTAAGYDERARASADPNDAAHYRSLARAARLAARELDERIADAALAARVERIIERLQDAGPTYCPACGARRPCDCSATVAQVAADIEQRERTAPALADAPFSLTSEPATRRPKQGGLF